MGASLAVLKKIWRIARWVILAAIVLYLSMVVYFMTQIPKMEAAAIDKINTTKLTMKDVDGSNLPPTPDPKLVDATVEGIDANHNNIRDDVELAIFKKYPNDKKVRAAELQYAMTEQFFLQQIISDKVWKAAAEQDSRANDCISDSYPYTTPSEHYRVVKARSEEVEQLIFNADIRKQERGMAATHTTSSGTAKGDSCDVQV